jgi:two-component system sensor histidine kinase KdpD
VAVIAALIAPVVATVIAQPLSGKGPAVPALIYLLAVVGATAFGGFWSGLGAAVIAFLGLNFFFTPPKHTLRVTKQEDVVALVVFLLVSAVVGALLSRAIRERERAQRREAMTRLLYSLALRLRSGDPLERTLGDFAQTLVESFGLASCTVTADVAEGGEPLLVSATGALGPAGPAFDVPLVAGQSDLGILSLARPAGAAGFSRMEKEVITTIASQTAFALDRARLDDEVRRANVQAEANEARAALFSSVTHDLRTPLASIKAGVSSLLQPDVDFDEEQEHELLATVLEETDRLNRLVGNLMDIGRIRAGALVPTKTMTAMEDVIDAVVARLRPRLERSRLHVRAMIRPDLPDIPIDPVQVDQLVTNLLENAANFSPVGGEILVVAAEWHSMLQVRVSDHGPGIPEADRERVFEAFHRGGDGSNGASGDRSAEGTGTGLGLAISKAIVEAHGGRIWIEGAPGGGAAVVFELPMGVGDA